MDGLDCNATVVRGDGATPARGCLAFSGSLMWLVLLGCYGFLLGVKVHGIQLAKGIMQNVIPD